MRYLTFHSASVVLTALTLSCGDDANPRRAFPECSPLAGACASDRDCNDGLFCNGAERCAPRDIFANSCGCTWSASVACVGEQVCDEVANACRPCDTDADGDGSIAAECGGSDCDDADADRFGGNTEICDATNHDEDCNPATFGTLDDDGDGEVSAQCCNGSGADLRCGLDCDDSRAGVNVNSPEVCNGRDDDCDGLTDNGVQVALYIDFDADGYGQVTNSPTLGCAGTPGFSILGNDCDDKDVSVTPGTLHCGAPTVSAIRLCSSAGVFETLACPGQTTCFSQPNGSGACR